MSDQAKFKKMLEILVLISGNFRYRISEIAERFKISKRTVYRYIETFRDTGFVVSKHDGYYQVDKNKSHLKEISDLLHFSEEEAWILSKAIHSIDDNTVLKGNLIKKLYSLYDFDRVANAIIKKELSEIVHNLITAIKSKRQVILHEYQSANSDDIRDRLLEPFDFITGYTHVWCYEKESGDNKLFKVSRIKKVEVTPMPWKFENIHHAGNLDVFRICSYEKIPVSLALSLRARNLLIEEYPLSEQSIQPGQNGKYLFNSWVAGFEGIGRFVLGLADEVQVIQPAGLIEYLDLKIKRGVFKLK